MKGTQIFLKKEGNIMCKIWKAIVTAIYGLGVITVLVLLALIVSRSHIVLFPDAMLPMELPELSSTWLALGFIPMLVFSILFSEVHEISESNHRIRNAVLLYLPTAVCLINFLFWACIWGAGIINMMKTMSGH